ncbi:MAG: DNA primase catalytic subunit PriS [Candidatus Micrarchaeota archaeon]
MNQQDFLEVKKIFASYYENADIRIPGIEQREFGFGNIKKIDARHLNFANVTEFKRYLATNTPLFVSHSTAYYEFPGATPIQKKQWKCADLVFDLDIHAEGKYGAFAKLDEVKRDLIRLVNDFLINDFGIKKEHVVMVFSGNRGYHVHVRDPAFISIGGEERRELVDYVMGQGLDYTQFFIVADNKRLVGPMPDESGYRGRLARGVIDIINEKPTVITRLFTKEKNREFFISGVNEGNWSKTSLKFGDLIKRLKIVADELPIHSVDTDVGVTQDLSKLIRVPNSIHGETGLIAKIVDDIETFTPWKDAIIKNNVDIKIRFIEDVPELESVFGGIGPFKKDSEIELKQHIAVFLVCKGSAIISR